MIPRLSEHSRRMLAAALCHGWWGVLLLVFLRSLRLIPAWLVRSYCITGLVLCVYCAIEQRRARRAQGAHVAR